jgi:hypothetical protein
MLWASHSDEDMRNSVHSGLTAGNNPLNFGEHSSKVFNKVITPAYVRFLHQVYHKYHTIYTVSHFSMHLIQKELLRHQPLNQHLVTQPVPYWLTHLQQVKPMHQTARIHQCTPLTKTKRVMTMKVTMCSLEYSLLNPHLVEQPHHPPCLPLLTRLTKHLLLPQRTTLIMRPSELRTLRGIII